MSVTSLVNFFENLPIVARTAVAEQMECRDLVILALTSEPWRRAIKSANIPWKVKAEYREQGAKRPSFSISYRSSTFKVLLKTVRRDQERPRNSADTLFFCYNDSASLQTDFLKFLHFLRAMSRKTIFTGITVRFNPTSPTFGMIFLKEMEGSSTDRLAVASTIHYDGRELSARVRKIKVNKKMELNLWSIDEAFDYTANENSAPFVKMAIAGAPTLKQMVSWNYKNIRITTHTRLDTESFQALLESWKRGGNENLESIEFEFSFMRNETRLMCTCQLLEGIDATKWDAEKRNGTFIFPGYATNKAQFPRETLDLSLGDDITRPDGRIGTLRGSTPYKFGFYVWKDPFPVHTRILQLEKEIDEAREYLSQQDETLREEVHWSLFRDLSEMNEETAERLRRLETGDPIIERIREKMLQVRSATEQVDMFKTLP